MKKFCAYIKIGVIDGLEMRFQLLYWLYINMAPIVLMVIVWLAVYQKQDTIKGYTLPMMITYYVVARFINRLISTYAEERIAKDIKDGQLNQYITRPIDYIVFKFGERIGIRAVNLIIVIPVYIAVALILRNYMVMPTTSINALFMTLNLIISQTSYVLLAVLLGMMAFFMVETHALFGIKDNVVNVISGYMFPLVLLPMPIQNILKYTPFEYYYHFPMQLYFNQLPAGEIARGFVVQLAWLVVFYIAARVIWRYGTRNYEAIGI